MYEDIKRYLRVVGNLTTMYIWPDTCLCTRAILNRQEDENGKENSSVYHAAYICVRNVSLTRASTYTRIRTRSRCVAKI